MTNEEALAYFIDNIEQIITTAKDENMYNYETQQIEYIFMRRDFEAKEVAIKALKQTIWTPVSEGLPEDRGWYLGIFKEPDTGWVNPLPFICDYVGSKTKATTKEHWILRGFTDRDEHIDYYFNLECVAWMPLPEPYKVESEGEE